MAEVQQDEEKEKNPEVISFIMAKKNGMAKCDRYIFAILQISPAMFFSKFVSKRRR